ncbi:MAG TPA: VCBS repeat-containing protein, partial [Kofleriaceae bacterium]|nr:VCBS repeat-containing protein [Kofleriaceae bacterium]
MRALLVCALALSGGCSLIFDGKDLRGTGGRGDGGTDMSGSVDGSTDLADSDGSAGADGGDGGASCTVMIGDAGMGHTVTEVPTGGHTSISIGLADFNMDGKPDIVAANEVSSNLSLLINDGAGKFTLAVQSPF